MTKSKDDFDPLYEHPSSQPTRAQTPAASRGRPVENSSGIDLPEIDEDAYAAVEEEDSTLVDRFTAAVQMAFIGVGQGGGRIAEAFAKLGYARVCAINTTEQDLEGLEISHKKVVGRNRGGAGKDPEQGRLAVGESREDVMDLMMRAWGEGVEQIYICVGAGGGSGSGGWPEVVKLVTEFCSSTNIEKPIEKHIGVIMSIPKRSEGARVQANALKAINTSLEFLKQGKISSLVFVDNARIHENFPKLPVKRFWHVANTSFAAVLHTFNLLATQNSQYSTFDRADFRSVIRNGIMIFGMTRVHRWKATEDISQAVRQNLTKTLFAEGFDLSKANMAGAIVVAHDSVLEEIPMENIDYAFSALGRTLGNEGITLHNGIYEGKGEGMRVFTIISGLQAPAERLEELKALAP